MKAITAVSLATVALMATMFTGCDSKPVTAPPEVTPEVNDENCKFENISKMKSKDSQQAFSALCLRRGGEFQPSPKREW